MTQAQYAKKNRVSRQCVNQKIKKGLIKLNELGQIDDCPWPKGKPGKPKGYKHARRA